MEAEKLKQWIAMIGGALGALLLFLRSVDFELPWFNELSIEAFTNFLIAIAPLVAVGFGVWKNSYLFSKKAKRQEHELKKKDLI